MRRNPNAQDQSASGYPAFWSDDPASAPDQGKRKNPNARDQSASGYPAFWPEQPSP